MPTKPQPAEVATRVARGEGFIPGQPEETTSRSERAFRGLMEKRKTDLLARRSTVRHPAMLKPEDIARARSNISTASWARDWLAQACALADHVVRQDRTYVAAMIPELTPTNPYGVTCPNCVGRLSQECSEYYGNGIAWDYRHPEVVRCTACGQVLPDARFPESGRLVCPRLGQAFTYYLNPLEQARPGDRSGRHAWHWASFPIHVSFAGIVRERKISFMLEALQQLALVYALTGEARYAVRAVEILQRFAHCYRNWLYHDYADTFADCDPLFAAWHGQDYRMPLAWKRNPSTSAYERDHADGGAMLSSYWGAGRIHPSCDTVTQLVGICQAYDLVHDAGDERGNPLWTEASRARVERDLLLEYLMGAEPWLGGHLKATQLSNKAGRAYCAVAAVGRCLGLPDYVDTALRGYESLRDRSFLADGFSRESPFYTYCGFLAALIWVPELLDGYRFPRTGTRRTGTVHVFGQDPKLRLIMHAMLDILRADGRYVPLSDTQEPHGPAAHLLEIGLKHYPDLFADKVTMFYRGTSPGQYALFHLDAAQLTGQEDVALPEVLFPAWKAAVLRHGAGPGGACLALAFNDWGGHLHGDSLNVFYADGGQAMLGDQGYVCDTPMNRWIHSTFSHNVVIVDEAEQQRQGRKTSLRLMLNSPRISVVEADAANAASCRTYRRLVVLVKGPEAQTFAIDIFRVAGGHTHRWRCFSEIAASDAPASARRFVGIAMPTEPDLPDFGGSVAPEHIFGLRDVQRVSHPPDHWQAIWTQRGRRYRLHMLGTADAVEAANGPGQEDEARAGRRVRYLDVIRRGEDLCSTFVALHEPSGPRGSMPIKRVALLPVPAEAGEQALALRIDSRWGAYLLFSQFQRAAEVDGVRFRGHFGVLGTDSDSRRWLLTSGASVLATNGFGFDQAPALWTGSIVEQTDSTLRVDADRPAAWPQPPKDVTAYVRTGADDTYTGYPVRATAKRRITVERFPLQSAARFDLQAVQWDRESIA